jgi:hypothetical protein
MEVEFERAGLEIKIDVQDWRGWLTLAGIGLVAACVSRELAQPPAERTWRGRLFGLVPYDLRPPTLGRLRSTLWNPNARELLVPTAFGVGWTLNLAPLAQRVIGRTEDDASV